ncbi:dihydroxyacetone kinase-like protein [Diaminobutyricimonas aerilata]|uniref:Dihydroxyacetone kinase-like protein n=1 Tax=Diaminobutyricimonas aerilata TaxID=1162967 RepID=A0A2M9CMJ5_9MICO|nr:dihydroxyacetone kinase subunit DhaL [Diaminobutyricimonas aerilata]PJJ73129.1 dihydroxyacetone kinase-like protein [Diaminobutyricimonas aerilata]
MARTSLTVADLVAWTQRFRDLMVEHRAALTELDSAIGDADHGSNMARGMQSAVEKLEQTAPETVGAWGKSVGMTLVSSVGGASGPLYGTFFLRFGASGGDATELDAAALGAALRAGLEGVLARGKAEPGDKTMIDALGPALDAFDAAVDQGLEAAIAAARDAAAAGRDATEPLQARKGRASYLGERSIGHVDPGATSTAYLFDALATATGSAA